MAKTQFLYMQKNRKVCEVKAMSCDTSNSSHSWKKSLDLCALLPGSMCSSAWIYVLCCLGVPKNFHWNFLTFPHNPLLIPIFLFNDGNFIQFCLRYCILIYIWYNTLIQEEEEGFQLLLCYFDLIPRIGYNGIEYNGIAWNIIEKNTIE